MPKSIRTSARTRASRLSHDTTPSTKRRTRSGQQPSHRIDHAPVKRRTPKAPALAFLARSQDVINSDPNRQLRLFALPRELLKQIASHLPIISTISLTLTCKEAAEAIGTQLWEHYKKKRLEYRDCIDLIKLLARDWADVLDYCERCNTLHPPLPPPRSHRETKLTKWCFGQDATIDYLPKDASHGYSPLFVHIASAIEESKDFASKSDVSPLIDTLAGSFTIMKNNLNWSLKSCAQRIDGNLVLKHVHTFQSQTWKSLSPMDLLTLPIRLCPHQSTTTATPEPSHHIRRAQRSDHGKLECNGRLLTHAIASAFPASAQQAVDMKSLKPLTLSEQAQVSAIQAGETVCWRCRSCPTKYHIQRSANGFEIRSWHSFGRDLYHASKYWKMFVRRTGTTLGKGKRNDEWWSQSQTVPDFICEPE
jgi:hypothetical protein